MAKTLACYARGGSEGWEAICVDLDIAVQGETFDEVYHLLRAEIADYLACAAQEAPDQARRLMTRSAPWYVRLRLKLAFLWIWFIHSGSDDGNTAGFTVPCHA